MKKILAMLLLASPLSAGAQNFDWNVTLDYLFNNSEFDYSDNVLQASGTVNALRISPYMGVLVGKGTNVHHRVMAGVDLTKSFGAALPIEYNINELQLFYRMDAVFSDASRFTAAAGCFPQSWRKTLESGPFRDDSRMFFDPNMEGMLFRYRTRTLDAELGLDWMGEFGDNEHPRRREQFEIFSSGEWKFSQPLSLWWNLSLHHFASCPDFQGVVDNHLVELSLDYHPRTTLDVFDVRIGALASYQWDRAFADAPVFPKGLYSRQTMERNRIGVLNEFYWGEDLMPYYFFQNSGVIYGDDLYWGMKCFRTGREGAGAVDNLTFYYNPKISELLSLKVAFRFQMGTPGEMLLPGDEAVSIPFFRGWQQVVSLNVNLETLRPRPLRPKRSSLIIYDSL